MKIRYISQFFYVFIIFISCNQNDHLVRKHFVKYVKDKRGNYIHLSVGRRNLQDISFLQKMNSVEILSFDGKNLKKIDSISYLTNLTYLNLGKLDFITVIPSLKNLNKLYHFSILDSRITDITPIGHLVNLEELSFSSSEITDISPLANCKKLKILGLQRCYKLSDITAVGELENLEHLEITYADALVDIRPIGKLKKLKYLELTSCNKLFNIDVLQNCDSLVELYLPHSEISFKEIEFIKKMPKLKTVGTNLFSPLGKHIKKIRPDLVN